LRPAQPQQPAPAAPYLAPSLPCTQDVEHKTLSLPEELEKKDTNRTEEQQKVKLNEEDTIVAAEKTVDDECNVPLTVPATEVEEELEPLYSSDDDGDGKNAQNPILAKETAMPGLITASATGVPPPVQLPLPPSLPLMQQPQMQHQQHVLPAATVDPMHIDQPSLYTFISPSRKAPAQIIGFKRRTSPQHNGGGSKGVASKPPLKMMKAEEYAAKLQTSPPPRFLDTSPQKQGVVLPLLASNNIAVGAGTTTAVGDLAAPIEPYVPLSSPPKKPSCLADAVTAAQMVAHLRPEGTAKPVPYALKPLPPPPPRFAAPQSQQPAAAAAGDVIDSGEEVLPSLNVEVEFASLGKTTGITQTGDSEPQEEHGGLPAAAVTVTGEKATAAAGKSTEGVRFARDLLFNRRNVQNTVGDRMEIVPAVAVPGAVPPPSAVAAPPAPVAANNTAALPPPPLDLPQNNQSTPVEAIQNLPPAIAAPPSVAPAPRSNNPPPAPLANAAVTTTAAAAPLVPTPFSATRPGSASGSKGPTASPASVELSTYLKHGLLDAMLKHGGVPAQIYQWQADCLYADGGQVLHEGRNLVYTAPTSAGKTLVAEILLLRALATHQTRKTMLVLPYQALCGEKARRLAPLLAPLGKEVREYHGGHYSRIDEHNVGIIVATIENANAILNRRLEEGSIPIQDEFSCIVCDELHLLSDPGRGYLLELLLAKLRYNEKRTELMAKQAAAAKDEGEAGPSSVAKNKQQSAAGEDLSGSDAAAPISSGSTLVRTTATTTTGTSIGATTRRIQIIGMSATLPNIKQLGEWLDAAVYVSDHRPVPLMEYLKYGTNMLTVPPENAAAAVPVVEEAEGAPAPAAAVAPLVSSRQLPPATKEDPNHVAHLTRETIDDGHSVLIFCATKANCVEEASRLARMVEVPVRAKPNVAGKANPPPRPPHVAGANDDEAIDVADEEDEDEDLEYLDVFNYTREAVAAALEAMPMPRSKQHAVLVRKGIAYHNADLSLEEKRLIEGGYRSGAISVLCATSTLAAGVNLPARRVIFLHAFKAVATREHYLTVTQYRQMSGRAGRAGIDDVGESILIFTEKWKVPLAHYEHLLRASSERIESCLTSNRTLIFKSLLT
jgi:hypothetical protein